MIRRLFALTASLLLPVAAFGAEWNLVALMHRLAEQRSGEARFSESKHLAILAAPVLSSGVLRFRAPDRLEKITEAPRPESLVLDGDTLTVTREARRQVVRLADYPQAAAFVDSIRSTLTGDHAALERTYALHLSGARARWTLSLLPRDPKLAERVLRITIRGSDATLSEIEVLLADGDRSVMTIRDAVPTR